MAVLRAVLPQESLVVVATGKYIGEGFDEPRLGTIPISWKGTLAQYAGRLHRNYAGKQEVRIYDYVDVHVPMLDRMYHKRLRGYSELGYQVKIREQDDNTSKIYDSQEYTAAFAEDLSNAARSILIVSPYIQKNRITGLLPILENAVSSSVRVTVYTKVLESYKPDQEPGIASAIARLKNAGISVAMQANLQQHYAIIDESAVWYGNIDFLAFGRKDANTLRFENTEIAGELLEMSAESAPIESNSALL